MKSHRQITSIHGRYFIHNDGMKYVLLNAAFTILDGLDVIGNRPLAEKERLGYFHAQIQMGQAMNIQGLSHSWDEMYGWFCDLARDVEAHPRRTADELLQEQRGRRRPGEGAAEVGDVGDLGVELLAVLLLQGQLPHRLVGGLCGLLEPTDGSRWLPNNPAVDPPSATSTAPVSVAMSMIASTPR